MISRWLARIGGYSYPWFPATKANVGPGRLPLNIVTGMRVAMASSFMSIIPAEILAADSGIGYLLQKSSMLLQTNRIFVALLTICVLGFIVDRIFRFFVDRVLARYMSFVSQT